MKNTIAREICSTKMIYKYDSMNKQNFHAYIDNKQNLFVVVKLMNGTIIGGFTTQPLVKPDPNNKSNSSGRGLIFNMNIERYFKLKSHVTSPIVNDAFYFILGNSQLRIRTQQKKILSNFGTTVSSFDAQGVKRNEFLGQNVNPTQQVSCETYEFYQLTLQ